MYDKRELIKAALRFAMEHSSPEALKQYLKDHPNADPKKHTVKSKSDSEKSDSEKSDSEKSDSGKSKKPKTSVKDAQKAFDDAKAAYDKKGLDSSDEEDYEGLRNGDKEAYFAGYGSLGDSTASDLGDIVYAISDAESRSSSKLIEYLGLEGGVAEKAKQVISLLYEGEVQFPPKALESKESYAQWAEEMNDTLAEVGAEAISSVRINAQYNPGQEHLPGQVKRLVEGLQREMSYALNSWGDYNMERISLIDAKNSAERTLNRAKDEEAKAEKEKPKKEKPKKEEPKKEESKKEESKKEKSKSIDEMSPAELKAQAEEAIKNSKMSPEEKQKAIKRMKKKKPEDMKAMLLSMGDEEEEGAGKQAFLRQANDLMVKIAYNQRCLVDLQRKIEELRRLR